MIYLADACALIGFLAAHKPDEIMPQAAPIIRQQPIGVLAITIWEIAQKVAAGKLPAFLGRWRSFANLLRDQRFHEHPFTWDDAEAAAALPKLHKDPVDRILIAAALRANLTVLTSDRIFKDYGVRTLW